MDDGMERSNVKRSNVLTFPNHVVLPQIAVGEMEEGRHRQQAGSADAVLEKVELGKPSLHVGVGRHLEASPPSDQDALGADR